MGEFLMEIKAITVNAAALAPERSAQEGRAKEDTEKVCLARRTGSRFHGRGKN